MGTLVMIVAGALAGGAVLLLNKMHGDQSGRQLSSHSDVRLSNISAHTTFNDLQHVVTEGGAESCGSFPCHWTRTCSAGSLPKDEEELEDSLKERAIARSSFAGSVARSSTGSVHISSVSSH